MRLTPATLILLPLLGFVLACGDNEAAPTIPPRPVAVAPVSIIDLTDEIEATGELTARFQARVAAEVSGRIEQILVRDGGEVAAGDVIMLIDPERHELELRSSRAGLTDANAGLREAQREAKRMRRLHGKSVAAQSKLDGAETALLRARSAVEAAQAKLGVAERALREASVTAPFAGFLAEHLVSAGEFVQPGRELFELVALDPIEVEFHLPEIDSSRVAIGNQVIVRVAPYPDREFTAEVVFISPKIDPRTRTLRVKGAISNKQGLLRPGLFARASLGIAQLTDLTFVPEESVLQRADGAVIFEVKDGVAKRRVVTIGRHREGMIQIVDGLPPETIVVTRGHSALIDGIHISVRNLDGSPTTPAVANGTAAAPH
jgi:membrane fusion protein (multidrug efflux system)